MGFSGIVMGYGSFLEWGYPDSWMVYFRENLTKIRMMTGGSPILGNLHMAVYMGSVTEWEVSLEASSWCRL